MDNTSDWKRNQSKSSTKCRDKVPTVAVGDAPFVRASTEESHTASKSNNAVVMALIRQRLNEGNRKFGREMPLDGTYRLQDALEEALDLSIYLSAKIIELKTEEMKYVNRNRKS
jgi:hypothetical protein